MQRHWRFVAILLGLILLGVVGGFAFGSLAVALGSVGLGLVVGYVMAIAFLRAEGHTPENHPRMDRLFDDTNP